MGSTIHDYIRAYRLAARAITKSTDNNIDELIVLRTEHWNAVRKMCGHKAKYNRCNYRYREWLPDCETENCPLLWDGGFIPPLNKDQMMLIQKDYLPAETFI